MARATVHDTHWPAHAVKLYEELRKIYSAMSASLGANGSLASCAGSSARSSRGLLLRARISSARLPCEGPEPERLFEDAPWTGVVQYGHATHSGSRTLPQREHTLRSCLRQCGQMMKSFCVG